MSITLTPEQTSWLEAHVSRGEYASIEDAVRQLIDERMLAAELMTEDDWAKPYVDEGLAALSRGETITLEEHKARNAARLAAKVQNSTSSSSTSSGSARAAASHSRIAGMSRIRSQ